MVSPNPNTLDHSFASPMSPDESSYGDFAIYSEMMFHPETQLGMISASENSLALLPVNSETGTFTDAPTIRSPTETDFTSIVDGIAKSIHFSVSDANSVTFQSVSSSSSRGKKERRVRAVGRGGAGNILNTDTLQVDYVDEADILRRRRLLAQINPRAKIANTGRGGTGNILAASGSTPYDPANDPDDEYEKIVHLEAQQKRMQQTVSTGRGGSGNVRAMNDTVRPRSHSLSIFSKKKKKKKDPALARPSTASTIATNTSIEQHELREYTLSSQHSVSYTAFGNSTATVPTTNPQGPGPSVESNQTDTSNTPKQSQRLAVSSAPPSQPVWRVHHAKPPTTHSQGKEKKEGAVKWWKKSSKKHDEEDLHAHSPHHHYPHERLDGHQRVHPSQTPNIISPSEELRPSFKSMPAEGIPRIAMRNPPIPSHVDQYDANTERSLSPGESQILNEVRMLAESKVHKNGHFNMQDLEEILEQTRHLHSPDTDPDNKRLPLSHPPHSHSYVHPSSQQPLSDPYPHPPPHPRHHHHSLHPSHQSQLPRPQISPSHDRIRERSKHYPPRKEMIEAEYDNIYPPPPIIRQPREHVPHVPSPQNFSLSSGHVLTFPSPPSDDRDVYEYSSTVSSFNDWDTQSISAKSFRSFKASRRERTQAAVEHEVPPPLLSMTQPIVPVARNLVKQRSDSALPRVIDDYFEQPDLVSEIHRHQLAMSAREINKQTTSLPEDESWSLHPVREEEDAIYFVEEEPYTSFIDI